MNGEKRVESEQTLISGQYFFDEKGQDELEKRRPHLDLAVSRYPRVLEAIEGELKQGKKGDLRGVSITVTKTTNRQNTGAISLSTERSRDKVQFRNAGETNFGRSVCREHDEPRSPKWILQNIKIPEEFYRIALAYAKVYVSTAASKSTGGGGLQITTEPLATIRGWYRINRGRGRGSFQGRGQFHRGNYYRGSQML